MSHRTQITLEDEQYARLREESARTGLGLAELIRRAIDDAYGACTVAERRQRLDLSFASWADVELDGATYVEARRRGLGQRLAER